MHGSDMEFSRFILPEGSGRSPELTRFLRQHKDTLRTAAGRNDHCVTACGTDLSLQRLSLRCPESFADQTGSIIDKCFGILQAQACMLSDHLDCRQLAGTAISKSVIMNLQCAHAIMLIRAIVYTAITRARLRLTIVGERKALCRAIRNTKADQRGTRLAQRIQDFIE